MSKQHWIYEPSDNGLARFVLGTVGDNPLVCFGINPSTAKPDALDRTVSRVSKFATKNGFDSWTMLNVYPQIATDPKELHDAYSADLKAENEQSIARVLSLQPRTLLAAWGDLITSKAYLPVMLHDIVELTTDASCDWMSLRGPTVKGHPRHPLYVSGAAPLQPFDIERYMETLRTPRKQVHRTPPDSSSGEGA